MRPGWRPVGEVPALCQAAKEAWPPEAHPSPGATGREAGGHLLAPLTTARCPFLALVMSSSEPGVKSIMPSLPGPPANVMLEGRGCVRAACGRTRGPLTGPTASPALVDVDVAHAVGAEGGLGQGLNHVVTLQHHIPLGGREGRVRPGPDLQNPPPPCLPGPRDGPSACCPPAARAARRGCRSGC